MGLVDSAEDAVRFGDVVDAVVEEVEGDGEEGCIGGGLPIGD